MLNGATLHVAGVHEVTARLVRALIGIHRTNDCQLVGVSGEARQEFGKLNAADIGFDRADWALVFPVRLGVEGVDVAHAAT